MLRLSRTARRPSPRSEGGFTLVELLVVIIAGLVVVIALFALVDVTLRQTTRTFSAVDATQHARTALEEIENEAHSACLLDYPSPIQPGSTDTSLRFVSQYGSTATAATAANPYPVLHTIAFDPVAKTLTDTTSPFGGGVGTIQTTTLLTNVGAQGSAPVFQYFAYAEPTDSSGAPYTDGAGNPYEMLIDGINAVPGTAIIPSAQPLAVPLSIDDAGQAAEVLIKLQVGASGGTNENTNLTSGVNDSVTDQVVLRLTPPVNHAGSGTSFEPCQ
ncbi:MAG: type II secretion system protein [Chloroflexi bacterium]|nr:type II secretion system protein [Chloroflexota bacterium]